MATALITHVQRFSVHDGPGIRSTVFFKGCPLRCRWCQNPEALRREPELSFNSSACEADHACLAACPRGALAVGPARVTRELCDGCGRCVAACRRGAFEVIGRTVTVEELLGEVGRDEPFYRASGGGVTLSGGEPTLQMQFAVELAQACRRRGFGVGLQTCGAFRWEDLAAALPHLDFIHFDLKAIDPERHRALTGADNRAILDNARRLAAAGARVTFRTPIVPGANDGDPDLVLLAGVVRSLGGALQLLQYHDMGEAKLPRLGFPLPPAKIAADQASGALAAAAARLRQLGLEIRT